MRPRCCFRYLTFFGINMMQNPQPHCRLRATGVRLQTPTGVTPTRPAVRSLRPAACSLSPCRRTTRRTLAVLFIAAGARTQPLTLVQPHLHANLAVGGVGFREAVIDV